ncbi:MULTISPECIES: deaminase domain-containing protein [Paenibacillus]|uniref:deaminase domain-containing protein n=1 Tax=Paenibacillus TaxID=44249 RepID=UPI002FE13383
MVGYEQVSIVSPYPIKILEDISLEWKPNEHGKLTVRGFVDETAQISAALKASMEETIQVIVSDKAGEYKIFHGVISKAQTVHRNGTFLLELEAMSATVFMDLGKKRRSFQNKEMTYQALIQTVMADYPGHDVIQVEGSEKRIGEPIVQYDETDWEFLKRIASHFQSVILSDILEAKPRIYVGMPKRNPVTIPSEIPYRASKDLLDYTRASGSGAGLHHTDYFRYDIESDQRLNLGDAAEFRGKSLVVSEVKASITKGIFRYTYRLARREGLRQTIIHNQQMTGVSIQGKVLEVQGEQVKLHLEIDGKQPQGLAYWFPFAPPTGNAMYSMPVVGTEASLYFPDDQGGNARVIGCVRTNGEACGKTGNPNNRYFGTEHGSELEITPTAINVMSGSKEPLKISFDDATGVILTSHRKLTFQAAEDISLYTPKRIVIRTTNLILAKKLSKQSGFTIENEYQILGDQVLQYGSDRTTYPKFDDEPATWTPPKEEKKKFSWGKLFGNVMAGLAVVALVTVAAAFTVATMGAGAVVVGAVVAGAAMAGTAAVATMAISDIARGEVSDTGDYMWAAFRDSSIGAVTGAVFGPFGGAAGFVGKTAFNAAESAAESVMSQLMEGSFSLKTLLIDTGIGTLTAGALDSKIAKNIGGALGQGTNKALSKVMGNNLDKASRWVQGGLDAVGSKLGKAMDQVVDAGRRTGAKTGLDQVAPWIANGVEAARRKASQSLEQLAETGSALAQSMFSRNRAVPAGGPDIEVEVPTRRNNELDPPDRKDPPPPKRHPEPEPDKKPDQHHEPEPKKDNDQGNGDDHGSTAHEHRYARDPVTGELIDFEWVTTRAADPIRDKELLESAAKYKGRLSNTVLKSGKGNFCYTRVELEVELPKNEYFAHSQVTKHSGNPNIKDISEYPDNPIFKATEAPNSRGRETLRDDDTEFKILNNIAKDLGDKPEIKGKITLFTEKDTCGSCNYIISQFKEKYPNIEIEVVHNRKIEITPIR